MKNRSYSDRQGSIIILALIIVIFISLAVGGYLKLAMSGYKMSEGAHHANSLVNMIEGGAERAIWTMYNDSWSGWTKDTNRAMRTYSNIPLAQGETGDVFVHIRDLQDEPILRIESRIRDNSSGDHWKQTEIELALRSFFINGLVATESLTFSGNNISTDSYNSDYGPYDPNNPGDKGSIASTSISPDAVNLGNADIYGSVSTASGSYPDVGPQGSITNEDTTSGSNIDPDLVSTDFYAVFPDVDKPGTASALTSIYDLSSYTGGGGGGLFFAGQQLLLGNIAAKPTTSGKGKKSTTTTTTTTTSSDSTSSVSNGVTQVGGAKVYTIGATGNTGSPEMYHVDGFSLGTNDTINIVGPTIIVLDGDTSISGAISITNGASLELYTSDDLKVSGNGVTNDNPPESFMIYGTQSSGGSQDITYSGNALLSAVIYAPNANLTMSGSGTGGEFFGAAIAKNIEFNGSYEFHYDESLEDLQIKEKLFRMTGWFEIIDAENRVDFDSLTLASSYNILN